MKPHKLLVGVVCSLALPATAVAVTPATIGGVSSSRLVSTMSKAQMKSAVAQDLSLPVTSAETRRLNWLNDGHLSQMTLYDAAVAAEIASAPAIVTSETTTPVTPTTSARSSQLTSTGATPDVNVGTCWDGNQNQKKYTDVFGYSWTLDAGITGYCDGPGGSAIVARGNYLAGHNYSYPDACNGTSPAWHETGNYYDGPNPQLIEMLNTLDAGYNTPIGCVGFGEDYAVADWVNYQGYYGPWNYIGGGWGQPGWGTDTLWYGPYQCCSKVTDN